MGGERTCKRFDLRRIDRKARCGAVAVVKDALYSIGGASEAGHVGSTRKSEVLDLSGKEGAPVTANVPRPS